MSEIGRSATQRQHRQRGGAKEDQPLERDIRLDRQEWNDGKIGFNQELHGVTGLGSEKLTNEIASERDRGNYRPSFFAWLITVISL